MMELIDEKTKKRLDTISECFDLEDYFKKIESKSKDIYYQTVALVITKDKLIARPDFCLHVNAATEIYKREFPNFKKFTDDYKDEFVFWGEEGSKHYGTVNSCLSISGKFFPLYIPERLSVFQYEQICRLKELGEKYGIEFAVNIKDENDNYYNLCEVMDKLGERTKFKTKKK